MVALDTSILAHAINRHTPEHSRSARLVEELVNGTTPWALAWPTVHEFLLRVTHPHAVARPLGAVEAWGFIEQVLGSLALRLLGPTERHAVVLAQVLESMPNRMPRGLETAVVLREHGIRELLTCDRGMERFRFLTILDPVHGEPWDPTEPPTRRYRALEDRTKRATKNP